MFHYDPGSRHDEFRAKGYIHLKNNLFDEFRRDLVKFYERSICDRGNEMGDWNINGKKRQYLFDFASSDQADDFRQGMARLIGIDPGSFTISERHLKVYDEKAPPWPAPHKDRAASVFPELQFGQNREEHAVFLSVGGDPESLYRSEEAVMLNEELGDVIAFLGSSIFHERVHAAKAAILYVKVNGSGADPLGENLFARESAGGEGAKNIQSLTLA